MERRLQPCARAAEESPANPSVLPLLMGLLWSDGSGDREFGADDAAFFRDITVEVVIFEMALGNRPSAMHVPPLRVGLEEPISEPTTCQAVVDENDAGHMHQKARKGLVKKLMQRIGRMEPIRRLTTIASGCAVSNVQGWFKYERE